MKQIKNTWEFIKPVLIALCISAVFLNFAQPTIVRGDSMLPSYHDGDYLITIRTWGEMPEKGEVVILKTNYNGGELLIKRVIATGGDKVSFKDGYVYVNEEPVTEPYVKELGVTFPIAQEEYQLEKDEIFCMGDNRLNSADSRSSEVGVINVKDVIGTVKIKLFSIPTKGGE